MVAFFLLFLLLLFNIHSSYVHMHTHAEKRRFCNVNNNCVVSYEWDQNLKMLITVTVFYKREKYRTRWQNNEMRCEMAKKKKSVFRATDTIRITQINGWWRNSMKYPFRIRANLALCRFAQVQLIWQSSTKMYIIKVTSTKIHQQHRCHRCRRRHQLFAYHTKEFQTRAHTHAQVMLDLYERQYEVVRPMNRCEMCQWIQMPRVKTTHQ